MALKELHSPKFFNVDIWSRYDITIYVCIVMGTVLDPYFLRMQMGCVFAGGCTNTQSAMVKYKVIEFGNHVTWLAYPSGIET